MRRLPILFIFLGLASCSTQPEPAPVARIAKPVAPVTLAFPTQPVSQPPPPPASPSGNAEVTRRQIAGITFEGVAFDSRRHRLIVADQPGGPGSRWPDAASAGRSRDALAAINAGFFTPEGAPLGLVRSAGNTTGAWNRSSLGSGFWHDSGNPAIHRRGNFTATDAKTATELIQAGPLLIENGQTVSGLDDVKPSVRSMILWDGGTRWWIGRSGPCTLSALSNALASASPTNWPVRHALNLDGGRSSDLWISNSISGGPVVRRSAWNRPVRNFLLLVEK
jgi:hypothetical protein